MNFKFNYQLTPFAPNFIPSKLLVPFKSTLDRILHSERRKSSISEHLRINNENIFYLFFSFLFNI